MLGVLPTGSTFALREDNPRPSGAELPAGRSEPAAGPETDPAIRCGACGCVVTTARQGMVVQGTHEHRFMNPAGILYHIGCFAEAVGCVIVGPPSHEYPWFPGFAWRFALCGGCRWHLGWHFRREEGDGFFGLIRDRLREGDSS
jgi:hypothetical protein